MFEEMKAKVSAGVGGVGGLFMGATAVQTLVGVASAGATITAGAATAAVLAPVVVAAVAGGAVYGVCVGGEAIYDHFADDENETDKK